MCRHEIYSKLRNINQFLSISQRRGYSSCIHFKKENKSDGSSRRSKRKNHWKDFADNAVKLEVKLKFIKNTNTLFVGKSEVLSNTLNVCKGKVEAQNLSKLELHAGITRTDVESIETNLMKRVAIEDESSFIQIETTDLASSISKFFDKKPKSRSKIYFTKCPCRRCQTLRRINLLTSNHISVDSQNKFNRCLKL